MKAIYEPTGRALEYSELAVNLYRGCVHGCDYCYVPAILRITPEQFHAKAEPRPGILAALAADVLRYAGTSRRVLLCFSCDAYQPIEAEKDLTGAAIALLRRERIPFQVLTKAGRLAMKDFAAYSRDDAFAVTLTSLSEMLRKEHEPKAAPPAERIGALIEAHRRGIETWVSLEPVLDCEESLRIIKETHEFVDHYKIGTLNHCKSDVTMGEWRDFGKRAVNLCTAYRRSYWIKQDLAAFMRGITFTNTDRRRVTPK
jgi:DNA repair photolyase